MEDTTDKPAAPETSTGTEETPLTDKDLGQATDGTGESQDDSDTSTATPQPESETEGTDEDATSEGEEGEAEGQLLTPEEIAKLPPELKAQYVSMNKAFQSKMGQLNTLIEKAQHIAEQPAAASPEAKPDTPVFIDRAKLAQAKGQDEVIAILEEGMQKLADYVADQKVGKAMAPLQQREAAAEVDSYFKANPDRAKFKTAMGQLDLKTKGSLTLDELYYAVSGKDREATDTERKQTKLRNLNKGNAETSTGTSGRPAGEGDIFDDIAKAGGRDNNPILR